MTLTLRALALVTAVLIPAVGAAESGIAVRTLQLDQAELPETHVRTADGYVELEFSNARPAKPVEARADGFLSLVKPGGTEEEPAFEQVARVAIPSGASGVLLLAWNNDGKPSFVALRDDFASAGPGDWLLINASATPVALKVGAKEQPVRVDPGKSEVYRVRRPEEGAAPVTAVALQGKQPEVIYSTYWPVRENSRCLVLFTPDGKKVKVRRIADKIVADPPG